MPEELVEVSVLHVLEHHDERVALHADAVKRDDVFVLKVRQELGFTVEILPGIFTGLFKCLHTHTHTKGHFNKATNEILSHYSTYTISN